jgi:Uncharacterized protein conserved in bacteria
MAHESPSYQHAPLLSPAFVWKVTIAIAVLCALTVLISIAGRMFGRTVVLSGHTTDETVYEIVIGNDVLALPANVIRFSAERVSGVQRSVDTYFAWPGMKGYSEETRAIFDQTESADGLIFARVTQATMSRDMSGRFEPIYSRLVEGTPVAGPSGLVSYRMKQNAGYANELLYVDAAGGGEPYVVRCLIEGQAEGDFVTRTGCQRDIHVGEDLSLIYRFSESLLPHWREIEADVRARFDTALAQADINNR